MHDHKNFTHFGRQFHMLATLYVLVIDRKTCNMGRNQYLSKPIAVVLSTFPKSSGSVSAPDINFYTLNFVSMYKIVSTCLIQENGYKDRWGKH